MSAEIGKLMLHLSGGNAAQGRSIAHAVATALAASIPASPRTIPSIRLTLRDSRHGPSALAAQIAAGITRATREE
jgi:hypothetical protein